MHEATKRGGQAAGRRLLAAVLCGLLYCNQAGAGSQSFLYNYDQSVDDTGCSVPVYAVKASRVRYDPGCMVLLYTVPLYTVPLYDVAADTTASSASSTVQALQTEMDVYSFDGSAQQRQQMHGQLEAQLSRRGFYRLWNLPVSIDGMQQAEAWYDAQADRTVVCLSWATAGGEAQQVWVISGKLNRQDFLPLS